MYENIKIGLLGGDMRQAALARRLSGMGFETAVWGIGMTCDIGSCVRCSDAACAVRQADAVILPLPASRDGTTLNCPLFKGEPLRLSDLFSLCEPETVVLGGKLDPALTAAASRRHLTLLDYFDCEELQIKNALPTAEGAIAIALDELPITLFGSNAAVTGYGRVGRAVTKLLCAMGAHVTVAARRGEQLAYAELDGCVPLSLRRRQGNAEPLLALSGADVIFNTVPYPIFTRQVLEGLSRDTLLIDLAGGEGGVDRAAAEELGIRVIWALSLPGKAAPFTAGNIICDCVLELLREKGVVKPK